MTENPIESTSPKRRRSSDFFAGKREAEWQGVCEKVSKLYETIVVAPVGQRTLCDRVSRLEWFMAVTIGVVTLVIIPLTLIIITKRL